MTQIYRTLWTRERKTKSKISRRKIVVVLLYLVHLSVKFSCFRVFLFHRVSLYCHKLQSWIIVFLLSFASRYFFISPLIYSVTNWLFSSILFSLHTFVFFSVGCIFFFSCSWFLVLCYCGWKRCLIRFQSS